MKKIFVGASLRILATLIAVFGLSACSSDSPTDPFTQLLNEITAIDNFIVDNGLTAITDHRGIRMVITEMGTGLPAKFTNSVNVDYVGRLLSNNTIFDQGNTTGPISQYIDGWKIVLTTLPVGSKAKVFIPSYWGYGAASTGSIPANSTLVFDIDFKEVIESAADKQRFTNDTTAIGEYLVNNTIDAISDTTGVSYVVEEMGGGPVPSWFDRVAFTYRVSLLSDENTVVFEESVEPTDDFLSRVVYFNHAWKIALQKIPDGSIARFYVPSGLAYGSTPQQDTQGNVIIPANSNVVIEIELTDVLPE
jgi:FKBP-type peptidyl-prolyl cis-trans isomerase